MPHDGENRPAPLPGGGRAAHRVDFAGLRLYRSCMNEETSTPLVLTPRAVEMVKQVRAKEGFSETHALRVSVVGGGCSGFSYQLGFDEHAREGDQVLEYDGVQVLIDPSSAEYLVGTEIDFVSRLHGGGFQFSNPKATHTCGCGSSFAV